MSLKKTQLIKKLTQKVNKKVIRKAYILFCVLNPWNIDVSYFTEVNVVL